MFVGIRWCPAPPWWMIIPAKQCGALVAPQPFINATNTLLSLLQLRKSKKDQGDRELGPGSGSHNTQTGVLRKRSQSCEQSRRWGDPAQPRTEELPRVTTSGSPNPPGRGYKCGSQSTAKNCLKTSSLEGEEHINDMICIFFTRQPWRN